MIDENQQDDQKQSDDENNPSADVTLEQLQSELDSAMASWKRAAADFENYKRRKEEEIGELMTFTREVVVAKLLPTLDALEQALKHLPEYSNLDPGVVAQFIGPGEADKSADYKASDEFGKKYQNWQTGVNGIVIQLDKALDELGVKKIEAVGKKFNPHFHEAVREVESDKEDGTVLEEFQTGFELNGKVIRPSQVVISKKVASSK